ncbi:hypothetical protein RAMLITH_08685 [Ramlibacter sp. RBP-2]|uniref:DUF4124 domain-containing protein n=1 Tax=Ramlibacter lithotrophicus TaxID=2606681 RepID=A0A7X6DF08_9BURK|nr:hypothetical protein [Ramlibacter lithotrophicus]NKE65893.1 hypothetical protein [Ramlibacter lithotrophicus]
MKLSKTLLTSLAAAAAWLPAHACYTVYDAAGRVAYRSTQAPVDMSRPLRDTLPQRFPGGHMVFDAASTCDAIVPEAPRRVAAAGPAPLLTDRDSAQAAGVNYAPLSRDIVMVQPRDAAVVLAGGGPVNVIPPVVAPRMLAQALTPPDTSRMGGPPAGGTVITELRDPPVTIIESRGGVTANVRGR